MQLIIAKVVRLENRPHSVIALLLKRVVLVIVTAGTIQGEAKKRLRRMLDDIVEPDVAVELVPVPRKEPCRA